MGREQQRMCNMVTILIMQRSLMQFLVLLVTLFTIKSVHGLDRLGGHTPASSGTSVIGGIFPQPTVMYSFFLKLGEPLLMKAVLDKTKYVAYTHWTDKYLKEQFEDAVVTLKVEDLAEPIGMTMSRFIEDYQDSSLVVHDVMPEQMKAQTLIPSVLQCGGIQDNLHHPELFFSNGSDKTLLYYNDVDYFTCLLDGEQNFVLFDKKYKELIEADGWSEEGGYSIVDVDDVDKSKFPGLYTAPWQKATVRKGDCLLVPYGWYQHISTPPGRTLAIFLKFSHLWWFDKEHCDSMERNGPFRPVSEFNLLDDVGKLRTLLLAPFSNSSAVSKEEFQQVIDCGSDELREQFWSYIDSNNNGSLSWPELYNFDMNFDQNKFASCYRNLKRIGKSKKNILKPSVVKTFDNINRPQVKVPTGKIKTEAEFEGSYRKVEQEYEDERSTDNILTAQVDEDFIEVDNDLGETDINFGERDTEFIDVEDENSDEIKSKKDKYKHDEF